MGVLPDKLSELITIALEDLAKVEASDQYTVDMGRWYRPNGYEGTCLVCFAGSVMAMSLEFDRETEVEFQEFSNYFDPQTSGKFLALDAARRGKIGCALWALTEYPETGMKEHSWMYSKHTMDRDIPSYDKHTTCQFRTAMIQLAHDLHNAGL